MKSKNSLLNFFSSYFIYFILVILGIFKVRIFLSHLGQDLYALNQLYVNLYSYLAIAEGGVGMALIYRLYPRFAQHKKDEINALYSGTVIIYRWIGLGVILSGFVLALGIPLIIKDNTLPNLYILLTFMLFVIRSAVDYFFIVPRLIIQADQKMYKVNLLIFGSRFFIILTEILIIMGGHDYVWSLVPGILLTLLANILINRHVKKLYPWLKKGPLKDFSTTSDTQHLLLHKGLHLITKNIDIVLMSYFLGALSVTIYAAYNYFIKFALDSFEHLFNAVKDAMGLLFQEKVPDDVFEKVRDYFSLFNFVAVVAISLFYLNINKFITLWIGKAYLTDALTLILILILVYVSTMRQSFELTKTALGKFKETKRIAVIQAALNLSLSLLLVTPLGMKGVILGTIISFFLTDFWYYPRAIYKTACHLPWASYYKTQGLNLIVLVLVLSGSQAGLNVLFKNAQDLTFGGWLVYAVCSTLLVGVLAIGLSLIVSKPFERVLRSVIRVISKPKVHHS
jgi:O-antigen/teichoic acid export membrane protein